MASFTIRSHTLAFVQLASGEIFTTPNFASQPTIGTTARSVL